MSTIKVEITFTEEEKKKLNEINDDQQLKLDNILANMQKDGVGVEINKDSIVVAADGTIADVVKSAKSVHDSIFAIFKEDEEESPTILKEVAEKFTKLAKEYAGSVRMGLVTWCEEGIGYSGNIPAEIAKQIIDDAVS